MIKYHEEIRKNRNNTAVKEIQCTTTQHNTTQHKIVPYKK